MKAKGVNVHMNAGSADTSYANNSAYQKIGMSKALHVLDETLKDMIDDGFSKCFKIADLGCASGSNSISVVCHIIDTIQRLCKEKDSNYNVPDLPEFEVFLNDLPENDFNSLFKMLPSFYQRINQNEENERKRCFVSALPGSFYGRLFPSKSMKFFYSSYSLHWLSQVPDGLEKNRKNVHMAMDSPPEVFEAYAKHYKRDFCTFLSSRGEEMIPGGRMVLIFVGRSTIDPSSKDACKHFAILAETLLDMMDEGQVKEDDLHSFNMPVYTPCREEIEAMIRDEGSFNLDRFEHFLAPWDAHGKAKNQDHVFLDNNKRGELVSNFTRAYSEPIISSHFGSSIVDGLYERYAKKLGEYYLFEEEPSFFNIVLSLRKK